MKKCSECGQPFDDQYSFCPDDGAPLAPSDDAEAEFEDSGERLTISEVISGPPPVEAAAGSIAVEPAREESAREERMSHVLRCPGCGTEYPQTFSSCPIDGFRLARTVKPAPVYAMSSVEIDQPSDLPASTQGPVTRPLVDPEPVDSSEIQAETEAGPVFDQAQAGGHARRSFVVPLASFETAPRQRRAYFPRALILILLAIFALAGFYLLMRGPGSGKQNAPAQTATVESSFIDTPQAARDFEEPVEEEPVEPVTAQETEPRAEAPAKGEPETHASSTATGLKRPDTSSTPAPPPDRQPSIPPTRQGPTPEQLAAARMNEVARQASDSRVNARLTRVRGRRTSAGYRYDLTFTLQSNSQLSLYWDKLLISTRSARGTNNSMVVPFSHNLGADGSMTFTISVEMRGAAEADWEGRITCTSLGRDASGRLTRAAFSTSVAPG